ncbi:MAG: PAS domain S-box protein, partial [Candidatus Binatia bacterium]
MMHKFPLAQAVLLITLITAGVAGNYFSVPLFFGVDFLFGSIAVFIVLHLYGVGWGLVAALIAASYTFVLWEHPYAIVIFTCEALFVGLLLHRKIENMVLLDAIFWIFLGMPMVWLFYSGVMHMDDTATRLIMFKQSVNGIFKALVASLIVAYTPIRQWGGCVPPTRTVSFRHAMANLFAACFLIPALLIMVVHGREELHKIETDIRNRLGLASTGIARQIRSWQKQHLSTGTEVAKVGAPSEAKPSGKLQRELTLAIGEMLKPYSQADALEISVLDRSKRIIASTRTDVESMQEFDIDRRMEMRPLDATLYQLLPASGKLPAMVRWKRSSYVQETPIGDSVPWTLVVQAPALQHINYLQGVYINSLQIMLILAVLALILAAILSRWLTAPLSKLADVTADIPDKVAGGQAVNWPNSQVTEMSSLVENFKSMVQVLKHNFEELTSSKKLLEAEVNERKQTEETLRKLSSVVQQTADHVIITDRNGVIEYVNPAFENFTGYTKGEVIGRTPRIVKSGQHDTAFYKTLWETILSGRVFRGVSVNRKKDGGLFYEEKTITPLRDNQGRITHFVSTGKDITERRRAEEEGARLLAETQRHLQHLTVLHAVTAIASESLDLDSILQQVIKKITEVFHFDCTRIFLFNPQMDELNLRASFETEPEFWAQTRAFKRGQGNVGKVGETGQPLIFEDIHGDPRYQELSHTKSTQKAGFSLFAVFPIKAKARTVGTIVCIGRNPRCLTADETQLITSMAGQIAVAVENATLYQESRRREEIQGL